MQVDFATTSIPTIMLWVLGLLVFLVGGLVGYFNVNIDAKKQLEESERKVQAARTEADRKINEANKKLEEARALEAQAPRVVEEPALLRLKEDGLRVQIEMDGKPLTAPLTPESRKRLIELINHIRPWLEGTTSAPQPAAAPPTVSKPLTATPPIAKPAAVPPVPIPKTVKPVPAVISLNPSKPKSDPAMEFKLLSMVQQIDVVLQMRIAGTPLEEMGIHLQDTLQGGLEVHIGTNVFETIDDVPDAEIKTVIRAAIAEWEQKYVPGA